MNEGDTVRLECQATGHPSPDIIWTDPAEKRHTGPIYTKHNLSTADQGIYRCKASNSAGEDIACVNLTVYCKFRCRVLDVIPEMLK